MPELESRRDWNGMYVVRCDACQEAIPIAKDFAPESPGVAFIPATARLSVRCANRSCLAYDKWSPYSMDRVERIPRSTNP
jgi:hypothetical protein